VFCEFVITCGQTAKLIEAGKEILADVPGFTGMTIVIPQMLPIRTRRDVSGGTRAGIVSTNASASYPLSTVTA